MSLTKENIENIYKLTPLQLGMYSQTKAEGADVASQTSYRIQGKVDTTVMEQALQALFDRYDILRTVFIQKDGKDPIQVILKKRVPDFRLMTAPDKESESYVEEIRNQDRAEGFNLSRGVLMRLTIVLISENEYELIWNHHHIILDGWCTSILIDDFYEIYYGLLNGEQLELDPPPPYSTYLKWLDHQDQQASKDYWINDLDGFEEMVTLPRHHMDDADTGEITQKLSIHFTQKETDALVELASNWQVTLNSLFQGAWGILLSQYTNREDIVFGAVVSGRPPELPGVEEMVGLFINTIPVRLTIGSSVTVREVVEQSHLKAIQSQPHHFTQIADIQKDLGNINKLYDHILVFENYPRQLGDLSSQTADSDDIAVTNTHVNEHTGFDLSISAQLLGKLTVDFEFSSKAYKRWFIEGMVRNLKRLLQSLRSLENAPINTISCLDEIDQTKLTEFSSEQVVRPFIPIVSQIEIIANETPNRTAICFEDTVTTYAGLNFQSEKIAQYLHQKLGVKKGDKVAVIAGRNQWLVPTFLGIWKAGAAYVAIDPDLPSERTERMLTQSGARIVLTDDHYDHLKSDFGVVSELWPLMADLKNIDLGINIEAEDLAYVLFTSGSTGQPKGVMIGHEAVSDYAETFNTFFDVNRHDRLLQQCSIGFDTLVEETFPILLRGGTLVPLASGGKDIDKLVNAIEHLGITMLSTTPTVLKEVNARAKGLGDLRMICVGGERLQGSYIDNLFGKVPIYNSYGPTESTVCVTFGKVDSLANASCIGSPTTNRTVQILDRNMRQVPVGAIGELYVGGPGLAKGYLGTESSNSPFVNNINGCDRLYRTGDLVRFTIEGLLLFEGRVDQQVKIRGYRIEPIEIEKVLSESPNVSDVLIRVAEGRLIAYVEGAMNLSELKHLATQKLPHYMVPEHFVQVEKFPLNTNGKIDYTQLPQVSVSRQYIGPRNETEEKLVQIWQEILDQDQIGIEDHFFEMGGHSLNAVKIIGAIKKLFDLDLRLVDVFTNPTIAELADVVDNKADLLDSQISPAPSQRLYPVSHGQRRLWVIDQLEETEQGYLIPMAHTLRGKLNESSLEFAFKQVIRRHEILRTTFIKVDGEPMQRIHDDPYSAFSTVRTDLSEFADKEAKLDQLLEDENNRFFDLGSGPIWCAHLIKIQSELHVLVINMHHIITDAWSTKILFDELIAFYNGNLKKVPVHLAPMSIQYKDYAYWQVTSQAESLGDQKSFWLQKMGGDLPVLSLPFAKSRPMYKTYAGDQVSHTFSKKTLADLRLLSEKTRTTMFMTMLGCIKALLYRYSGQSDIIVGIPVSGREQGQLQDQMGFYVNTLALRSQIEGGDDLKTLLTKIRSTTLEGFANQQYPFDKLVEELQLKAEPSRSPLFDTLMDYIEVSRESIPSLNQLEIARIGQEDHVAKFDLNFSFFAFEDTLQLALTYNVNLFEKEYMERMVLHLESFIQSLLEEGQTLDKARYLTNTELRELVVRKGPEMVHDSTNVLERFDQIVNQYPTHTAITCLDRSLTYQELDLLSDRLAYLLADTYEISVGDRIGLCAGRSEWTVVSMLGILKSGGTFVAIDPEYPPNRIKHIFNESKVKLIVADEKSASAVPAGLPIFRIKPGVLDENVVFEAVPVGLQSLAYILYTSGSTGNPKGVMISHKALNHYANVCRKYFKITNEDVILQQTAISFDLVIEEIFPSLLSGATVVILPGGGRDMDGMLATISQRAVSIVIATPLVAHELNEHVDCIKTVRAMLIAGDKLLPSNIDKMVNHMDVYNRYGPTETTVCATYAKVDDIAEAGIIGSAIPNMEIFLLDENFTLVADGLIGEIFIGGEGVAEGYISASSTNKNRFVPHPFKEGKRLYRSGDLGRWLPNGKLLFVGRNDDQVKVRGYRIELQEVEQTLLGIPSVGDAVALVKNGQLVAYHTGTTTEQDFRKHLIGKLPFYMLPSRWIWLEEMPSTISGKIDRKKLPEPPAMVNKGGEPRNDQERQLLQIWCDVLKKEELGIYDNFFEMGGHSLNAVKVSGAIKKALGIDLRIIDVFTNPTIAELADLIANKANGLTSQIQQAPEQSLYPVSHGQRRLWVIDQLEGIEQGYLIPMALTLKGSLNESSLEFAFMQVIQRHEILRTTFTRLDGEPMQQIHDDPYSSFSIHRTDLSEFSDNEKRLDQLLQKENSRFFDLESGPIWCSHLIKMQSDFYVLVINMHHIIADAWSTRILFEELIAFYNSNIRKVPVNLAPLSIQYKDYAWWQMIADAEALSDQKNFWLQKMSGELPILTLPFSKSRPMYKSYTGDQVDHTFSKKTMTDLRRLSEKTNSTMFMTMLGLVKALLYRLSGQSDIIVGVPVSGREQGQLQDQMGFYVNTLALRSEIDGQDDLYALMAKIRQTTLEGFANQHYPFDKLVEELKLKAEPSRSPLFDVMMDFNEGSKESLPPLDQLEIARIGQDDKVAKFDLSFDFFAFEDTLKVILTYNVQLYERVQLQKMVLHLESFIQSLLESEQKIDNASYLTDNERKELVARKGPKMTHNCTNVLEGFADIVKRYPEKTAIKCLESHLTYEELDLLSDRVAYQLINTYHISPGDRVGLCVGRSEWTVVSMLGILKSGGTFVALDPEYPGDRIKHIVSESEAKLIITDVKSAQRVPLFVPVFTVKSETLTQEVKFDPIQVEPRNLAYILYTSGSTGNPKGVMISHTALNHYANVCKSYFKISEKDITLQQSSISFDTVIEEVFPTLLSGGQVVIAPGGGRDIEGVLAAIQEHRISIISVTPLVAHELNQSAEQLQMVRTMIVGGDKLLPSNINNLVNQMEVFNSYGPTEATVCATYGKVDKLEETSTIGKAIPNVEIYLLDKNLSLVADGMIGEICIGGEGVAEGYVAASTDADERFIRHPFQAGRKLYRTGDLGRWLSSGKLQFEGRNDDQVKVRGYRIELQEIEQSLLEVPTVKEAVVAVLDGQLVAYHTGTSTEQDFRTLLTNKLPFYMLPSRWVKLEEMPVTISGKIDRKKLPSPTQQTKKGGEPRNDLERQLLEVWCEVFKSDDLGINDNFFELGGQSLKAISVTSKINSKLDRNISIQQVYVHPTIASLAESIEKQDCGHDILVELNSYQKGMPVLLVIPPIIGSPLVFEKLAIELEGKVSVLGFRYPDFGDTIESLAESIFTTIKQEYKERELEKENVCLFGFSMGVYISFEISKLMESEGMEHDLWLIDADGRDTHDHQFSLTSEIVYGDDEIKGVIRKLPKTFIDQIMPLLEHNLKIFHKYHLNGTVSSDITFVEAMGDDERLDIDCWEKRTTGGFNYLPVQAEHDEIFDERYKEMAQALTSFFEVAEVLPK